jgi:type IV pilus biogenesis protein CpaD/CtpE
MKFSAIHLALAAILLVPLAGCESTSQIEADFGNAYRNMVAAQIHNPEAARNPPADPPLTMDGQRASDVMEKYRSGEIPKGAAQRPLSIQ